MKRLFVRPPFRGQGVGKRLAERIVEEARAIGYATMRLDTLPSMQAAIRLHESLGSVRCAPYYDMPLRDTVFMELQLRPCSPRSTPVQESILVGRWQRVDRPAVIMAFLKDRSFSANVAGQRVLGGRYHLIEGGQLVIDCDTSSVKAGPVTNRVFMVGEELRIKAADGTVERYKRAE